jgi:allantoicase
MAVIRPSAPASAIIRASAMPEITYGEDDVSGLIELVDLAAARVGGKALAANDEFFAKKENLLRSGRGLFIADKYTARGKWMDGWETRRRRTPGHDWCVIRLGMPGRIRGVDVDTNHFVGNFPERASIDACVRPGKVETRALLAPRTAWREILPPSALQPSSVNLFAIQASEVFTHVRLNIYPDGGVARLRVYGEVELSLARGAKRVLDLASVRNGGQVLGASDMHFGSKHNLIMPGRSVSMADGWETRRRRGPGFDWLILKLATLGWIDKIEVDTHHFKGNYPESCSLEGCRADDESLERLTAEGTRWEEFLPRTPLSPHRRHFLRPRRGAGPFTHARFNIYPDGGVSRLRLHGRPVAP